MESADRLPSEARRFGQYLRSKGILADVTLWKPLSGGRSATSILVEFVTGSRKESAVLHLAPAGGPLAGISDFARQYELLEALSVCSIPSPRPLGFLDASWLGRQGYLSEYVQGHAPDPWRASGRHFVDGRRCTIESELMARLVDIHSLPVDLLPTSLHQAAASEPFGSRERRRWATVLGNSPSFSRDPLLTYADAWLRANHPPRTDATLIHGDFRIGNLVFDDAGRIDAVLDWELAELGDPLYDLGTLCSPALEIDGKVAGVTTLEALVAAYEKISGRPVDADSLSFYRALGTFKIACLWINASQPGPTETKDVAALRAHFSALDARLFLATALGLGKPQPSGRGDPVLAWVIGKLRDAADALSSEESGNAIQSCSAVLRAYSRHMTTGAFQKTSTILEFAASVGACNAIELCNQGKPWAALTEIVHLVMRDDGLARDPGAPVHLRLREILADTIDPSGADITPEIFAAI